MKKLSLDFHGPFMLTGEEDLLWDSPLAQQHGIYLWTVPLQANHYIEYIGETGVSFYQRTKEHLIQTMGGNYRILDVASVKQTGNAQAVWNGMWRKGTRDKIKEFIGTYPELSSKIGDYIALINVFVAPLVCEQRERRLIEGALAKYILSQEESIHKFLPKDIRYIKPKTNENTNQDFVIDLTSDVPIVGFPKQLTL